MASAMWYLGILLLGFPTGFLLAHLAHDELAHWRTRFLILAMVSVVSAVIVSFFSFSYELPLILSFLFIAIISLTIVVRSY